MELSKISLQSFSARGDGWTGTSTEDGPFFLTQRILLASKICQISFVTGEAWMGVISKRLIRASCLKSMNRGTMARDSFILKNR